MLVHTNKLPKTIFLHNHSLFSIKIHAFLSIYIPNIKFSEDMSWNTMWNIRFDEFLMNKTTKQQYFEEY